jgi:predicted nucleic acid-binding protein
LNGLDSSIVIFALDPTTSEHPKARDAILGLREWALTPTVVHEVYHSLVFKRGMSPGDARSKIRVLVSDSRTSFVSITRATSLYSLDLAAEFGMGGRDSLIVGCCMRSGVESILTRDGDLLKFGKLKFKGRQVAFKDPLGAEGTHSSRSPLRT